LAQTEGSRNSSKRKTSISDLPTMGCAQGQPTAPMPARSASMPARSESKKHSRLHIDLKGHYSGAGGQSPSHGAGKDSPMKEKSVDLLELFPTRAPWAGYGECAEGCHHPTCLVHRGMQKAGKKASKTGSKIVGTR